MFSESLDSSLQQPLKTRAKGGSERKLHWDPFFCMKNGFPAAMPLGPDTHFHVLPGSAASGLTFIQFFKVHQAFTEQRKWPSVGPAQAPRSQHDMARLLQGRQCQGHGAQQALPVLWPRMCTRQPGCPGGADMKMEEMQP